MTRGKKYASVDTYEDKLSNVMDRLGVDEENYSFDWGRKDAWIEFEYKGAEYRFEHSVEKANARGIDLTYGSDAFSQLVMSLEDLARMVERGIYDLETWMSGDLRRRLPEHVGPPVPFKFLGFEEVPEEWAVVRKKYKEIIRQFHPDTSDGEEDVEEMHAYMKAFDKAKEWWKEHKDG